MPNTPIWPGSSSFFPGETPFGFYDNDIDFQTDAQGVEYAVCDLTLKFTLFTVKTST